jgi:hypothetical protein
MPDWVSFTIGVSAVAITLAVAVVRYVVRRHDAPSTGPDGDESFPSATARSEAAQALTHNRIDRTTF